MSDLRATVAQVLPAVRADLERLVRIPSVSADPAAAEALRASAQAVAELLASAGRDGDVGRAGGGPPAGIGRRPAPPGAPTHQQYPHHHLQPAGELAAWDSHP